MGRKSYLFWRAIFKPIRQETALLQQVVENAKITAFLSIWCPVPEPVQPQARPSLRPLLKWSGGKRSEIPFLQSAYPKNIRRVVEPFSGGAAVAFDLNPDAIVLNDLSAGLVDFYRSMKDPGLRASVIACVSKLDQARKRIAASVAAIPSVQLDAIFSRPEDWVRSKASAWLSGIPPILAERVLLDLVDQATKKTVDRIPKLEKKHDMVFDEGFRRKHLETGLQSGLYTTMRRLYNHQSPSHGQDWATAAWWFVRSLCYSGMFRYARNGNYNVPYGGIGYNTRDFTSSIEQLGSPEVADFFARCDINELDFEALFEKYNGFGEGDFIFVDPPYDSAFSQYNPEMDFAQEDQRRLAAVLAKTKAPWMLVIKNTPFILSLYQGKGLYRGVFGKTYQANFRNRHARDVEHLVVANYPLPYVGDGEVGIQEEAP